MLVEKFDSRKACEYLDTGMYRRVLILFRHGLGDSVMFWATCLKTLRKRYPEIEFAYSTYFGQELLFGKVDDNPDNYDIAFRLGYPCSEGGPVDETKSEKCARVELGLPLPLEEDYSLPKSFGSPLVGVHFNSTSCSWYDVKENFGRRLWDQIQEEGFIPIDTHMRHCYDNPKSVIHPFEQCRRIDNVPATLEKLLGLIGLCRGFAGVPSGNLICALALMPERHVLYLSQNFPMSRHIRKKPFEMNVLKPYDRAVVSEWLHALRDEDGK